MKNLRSVGWLAIAAGFLMGCAEKPNLGSPVGKWGVFQASVSFHSDGTVVWKNDGEEFNPQFLAPLQPGQPGTWKTDGHDLLLTAMKSDGTTETQRYQYSVGTNGQGQPALDIHLRDGPSQSGYVLEKQ